MLTDADFAKGLTMAQIREMTPDERAAAGRFIAKRERQQKRQQAMLGYMGLAMALGFGVCIWVYAMMLVEIVKKAHGLG